MAKPFYDVFISHAYEDQNEFAGQLALSLKKKGLKVWYSGFELKLGASITTSVNDALQKSRYGIVLLSPVYLTKKWAMKELEALLMTETKGNRILPVLHGISVETLREKMPLLADKYAVSSRRGMNYVLDKIMTTVSGTAPTVQPHAKKKKARQPSRKQERTAIQNAGVIVFGGKADVNNAAGGNITIRKSKK
jgi:hypothetical protein